MQKNQNNTTQKRIQSATNKTPNTTVVCLKNKAMQFWSDSFTFQNLNLMIFLRVSALGFLIINYKTLCLYWIIRTTQPELLHQWKKATKTPNYSSPSLAGIYKWQPCHEPLEITTLPQHPKRGQKLCKDEIHWWCVHLHRGSQSKRGELH